MRTGSTDGADWAWAMTVAGSPFRQTSLVTPDPLDVEVVSHRAVREYDPWDPGVSAAIGWLTVKIEEADANREFYVVRAYRLALGSLEECPFGPGASDGRD